MLFSSPAYIARYIYFRRMWLVSNRSKLIGVIACHLSHQRSSDMPLASRLLLDILSKDRIHPFDPKSRRPSIYRSIPPRQSCNGTEFIIPRRNMAFAAKLEPELFTYSGLPGLVGIWDVNFELNYLFVIMWQLFSIKDMPTCSLKSICIINWNRDSLHISFHQNEVL